MPGAVIDSAWLSGKSVKDIAKDMKEYLFYRGNASNDSVMEADKRERGIKGASL